MAATEFLGTTHDERSFLLQRVQPAMTGLIDGSLSTLAPIFSVAIATHRPHYAFFAGLATAIGAGVSMAFSEGLSDTGDLTGRGNPYVRGGITGAGTFLGGILHTLPFLISDYRAALVVTVIVIAFELVSLGVIRWRFFHSRVRHRRRRRDSPVVAPLVSLGAFLAGSAGGGMLGPEPPATVTPGNRPRAWDRDRPGAGRRDHGGRNRRTTEQLRRRCGHRPTRAGYGCAQRHRQAAQRSRPHHHRADDDADGPAADSRVAGGAGRARCAGSPPSWPCSPEPSRERCSSTISLVPPLLAAAALALLVALVYGPIARRAA